ncbi:unnamed protein product [Closterium sp. NIES-54]
MTAPLQTLHMDVWGPARVSGQGRERYFLLVVDNYTRYTTVFPFQDLPVLRLHSDKGGEFSSNLLWEFCRGEGILQSFTLPESPQQNGIAERHIGLVMEVARTSMIHAAAPHFLWPFATRSPPAPFPASSLVLSLTRLASSFTTPPRAVSSPLRTSHSMSRFPSTVSSPTALPPPLFLAPGPPLVDPLPPKGPAPSEVSQVDPLPSTAPVQVAVGSGAAPGAASGGAASGGAAFWGAEPGGAGSEGVGSGGAKREGVEPGGAESEGAKSGGAEPRGAALSGGPAAASPRLSSQQLRECLIRRPHRRSGAPGAGGAGDTRAGGAAVPTRAVGAGDVGCAGAGDPTEPGATGAVGAGAGVAGVGGPGARGAVAAAAGVGGTSDGGAGAVGAGAIDPRAGGAGDTVRP